MIIKTILEVMAFVAMLVCLYVLIMSACALNDKCFCYYKGDELCQKLK